MDALSRNSLPVRGAALWLLLKVNLLQAWRKLLSLRDQSRLLNSVILLFVVGYIGIAFSIFYQGLRFISRFPGLGEVLVERLMFLLFACLFFMLLLSNIIIGYTNLFRSRETTWLLTKPVSFSTVFQAKFLETGVFASWAFVFLISPFILAYGLRYEAHWDFYLITPVMILLFIILPTLIGSWIAVNLARFMDRRSFQIAAISFAALAILITAIIMRPEVVPDEIEDARVLGLMDRLLVRTNFAQFPLLPSYWVTSGMMQWLEGSRQVTLFFIMLLLSYVGFLGFLAFTRMGNLFYSASSAVQSRGSLFGHWDWFRRRQSQTDAKGHLRGPLERLFARFRFLTPDVQAIMVKDLRMFWRDTTQWGQTLMLFGLLGVYILNLRHFSQQLSTPFWINLVSFLNLAASALNLATLTTRFVYPQFSLEGKRVWVIGMAPIGLDRMVLVKFWLATLASLLVTLGLILLSCNMLQLTQVRTVYFCLAVTVMTFTLNGMACGIGALYPNLREDNPSKIVSGFGGTLCLVLSFLYIVSSVALLAMGVTWVGGQARPVTGITCFLLLSVSLGAVPLYLGVRKARHFET